MNDLLSIDFINYKNEIFIFLVNYLSWINNLVSLIAAWCLSNKKIDIGRRFGVAAAILWMVYGFITEQYAFVVADFIFLTIYIQAIVKFNSKKREYQDLQETTEYDIFKLDKLFRKNVRLQYKLLRKNKSLSITNKVRILNSEIAGVLKKYR
jgi:hypothetical protein